MRIAAIDPGTKQSAIVIYRDGCIIDKGIVPNIEVSGFFFSPNIDLLAIEMVASYGMPVGAEVFQTALWIGRFTVLHRNVRLVYRRESKLHLCHTTRANDSTIRQALIDRYGGSRTKAIGTIKNPGPLYGFHADLWAALAVAIVADETEPQPPQLDLGDAI